MSRRGASRWERLQRTGVALVGTCLVAALGGCAGAGPSTERLPGARKVVGSTCSLRAVVNIRQGAPIRSDSDLVEIARGLGVTLSVLQSMGRNARMVVIRENGPPDTCEEALAELRSDLRIESVERH